MRTRLTGIALSCAGLVFASCGVDMMQETQFLAQPAPESALVKIHRPSKVGFAIKFAVWDRDHLVGISTSGATVMYECDAGEHLFLATAENMTAVRANLAANRVYDLVAEVKMGVWKARVNLVPVGVGSPYKNDLREYDSDMDPTVLDPYLAQEYIEENIQEIRDAVAQIDQGVWRGTLRDMGPDDCR